MYYFSYAIPVVAMLVALCFGYNSEKWVTYLLVTALAEGVIALMFYFFTRAEEYLSGYVVSVVHLNAWTEKVVKTVSTRDSQGHYQTTYEVRYVEHPDQWYWYLNTDYQQTISKSLFYEMCRRWGTGLQYFNTNYSNCVSGGGGEECYWNGCELDTRTVTYKHKYKNPVRYSNSLFKGSFINKTQARELGLFDYPSVSPFEDQVVILCDNNLPKPLHYEYANAELQRLNAFMGAKHEIHVFILLFQAEKGRETALKQRDYWKGLNKNEFVICLGVCNQKVKWCEALSWMDRPDLSLKTRDYFVKHEDLDLLNFVKWLRNHLNIWKRKEFKDFEYLGTNMSKGKGLFYWIVSIILGIIVFLVCINAGT